MKHELRKLIQLQYWRVCQTAPDTPGRIISMFSTVSNPHNSLQFGFFTFSTMSLSSLDQSGLARWNCSSKFYWFIIKSYYHLVQVDKMVYSLQRGTVCNKNLIANSIQNKIFIRQLLGKLTVREWNEISLYMKLLSLIRYGKHYNYAKFSKLAKIFSKMVRLCVGVNQISPPKNERSQFKLCSRQFMLMMVDNFDLNLFFPPKENQRKFWKRKLVSISLKCCFSKV